MPSILRRSDYEDCLVVLYFGRDGDQLQLCLRRAYGDFQRTLHGIRRHPRAEEARNRANKALKEMFTEIQSAKTYTQEQFDDWHRSACIRLAAIYSEFDYQSFSVGHAQKWLNMTFKYIYVMGESRLPGFSHLYDFCHSPLDNILITALNKHYDFPPLPCAWSQLKDYEIYLERQHWLRSHFKLAPLDLEFLLWLGRPLPADTILDARDT